MTVERGSVGLTHYEVLGVPASADRQEIARAYRAAMRRLHPDANDVAEDDAADELGAVQEAWRILQDAEARAAYDREVAGPADVWADLGWGVAVDDPDTDGSGAAASSRPPDAEGRGAGDPAEPWRTPFAPGAVPIPEPPPPSGPPGRGVLGWLLRSAAAALAVVTVVLTLRARGEVVGTDPFPGLPVIAAAASVGLGPLVAALLWWHVRKLEKGFNERSAGMMIVAIASALAIGNAAPWSYGAPATLLGLSGFGTVAALVTAAIHRRSVLRRAAADHSERMTAYHQSAEWNRIRAALRVPGSQVEESRGVPNRDEPHRVRTVDPATGKEYRRHLRVGLPRGAWVVIDRRGRVLATAPPGALEAWLACWGRTRADL